MSKNNSPIKFIGGMIGNAAASLSGGSNNSNNGFQSIMGGLFGNNPANLAAQSLMARKRAQQAQQVPRNPGAVRDPNNINAGSGSGVSVSQADLNTSQSRNSGPGVLTSSMHQMNSNMPMAKPQGETFKTVNPSFRDSIVEKGDGMFGNQEQRQASIDPVQDLNIDQTGMNSLYSGPLMQKYPNEASKNHFEAKGKVIEKRKKQYADVIDSKGKSQLNKPVSLFFNSGTRRAHGMGGTMDKIVEGAKNLSIPGRFATKLYKAHKYNKTSKPQ